MENTKSIDLELSSTQYLSITNANQTGLNFSGDFTIQGWIKLEQLPSTAGTDFTIIARYNAVGDERSYYFYIRPSDDNFWLFYSTNGGGGTGDRTQCNGQTAFTSADVGVWRHIAVTVDVSSATVIFYKDGVAMSTTYGQQNATSVYSGGTEPITIGALYSSSNPTSLFDGKIDELGAYDAVLTATEVKFDFNNRLSRSAKENDIVAGWNLNDDLVDVTDNANDLTNNNSATYSTDIPFTGVNKNSIALDQGDNSYLSITNASQTGLSITGDFSFMCWVKLSQLPSTSGTSMVLFSKKTSTDGYYFIINTADDTLQFQAEDDNDRIQGICNSASFVSGDVDEWVHIAVTVDVSTRAVVVYKNGVAQAITLSGSGNSIGTNTEPFLLGSYTLGTTFSVDGLMDEVGIYNTLKSATDVTDDYNLGYGRERIAQETGIVSGWRFDDDVLTDITANGNDLTNNNSATFSEDTPFGNSYNTNSIDLEKSSSQYLSITDASQTGLDITGDLSFMGWIKIEALPSVGGTISLFGKWRVASARNGYLVQSQSDVLQVRYDVGGATTYANTTSDFFVSGDVGEWMHIAITIDSSAKDIKIYKNGVSVANTNGSSSASSIGDNAQPFLLGQAWSTDNQYFDGKMDEIGIYDAVLSADTVALDYVYGYGSMRRSHEPDIVSGWRLDNGLLDITDNDNDLTNNNSATFSSDVPFPESAGQSFSVSDSLSLSEVATIIRERATAVSDTLSMTDGASVRNVMVAIVSDTISLAGSITEPIRARLISASDSIGLTGAISAIASFSFSVSDSIGLTGAVTASLVNLINVSDKIGLTGFFKRYGRYTSKYSKRGNRYRNKY